MIPTTDPGQARPIPFGPGAIRRRDLGFLEHVEIIATASQAHCRMTASVMGAIARGEPLPAPEEAARLLAIAEEQLAATRTLLEAVALARGQHGR